jgi:peptidoglycan DL-endopeptidase CwlO
VSSMPHRRHVRRRSFLSMSGQADGGPPQAGWSRSGWRACALLAGALGLCATVLSGATAQASPSGNPTLNQTLAEANKLSNQIDELGQQYDGLVIQLSQAKAEVKLAKENAARDERQLTADQSYIDDIAVVGYMTGGLNPSLQLLQASNPQSLLDRASIMTQLEEENGAKVSLVADAEVAAVRANAAASQEEQQAAQLKDQMNAKVAEIQSKENFFNSEAFKQAADIFQQTGKYPISSVQGRTIGVEALKAALTRIGDPYVWGGAGPDDFDCSGLVVWAYAQVGITLEHFTGDLWNEVVHIPYSEAQPGDLVFFYPDIGHVGIYIGNGLMVDAPTAGQDVQVQPVMTDVLVGTGYVPA